MSERGRFVNDHNDVPEHVVNEADRLRFASDTGISLAGAIRRRLTERPKLNHRVIESPAGSKSRVELIRDDSDVFEHSRSGLAVAVHTEQRNVEIEGGGTAMHVKGTIHGSSEAYLDRNGALELRAKLDELIAGWPGHERIERHRAALERIEPLLDAQFDGHETTEEFAEKARKLNEALEIVRAALRAEEPNG